MDPISTQVFFWVDAESRVPVQIIEPGSEESLGKGMSHLQKAITKKHYNHTVNLYIRNKVKY
jgi:hypothetical protein